MTTMMKTLCASAIFATAAAASADFHEWAKSPPMGWNSWDCFGTTITDEIARAQADAQEKYLKDSGWQYLVVDIQWYEGGSQGHGYRRDAVLTMDEFGRLLPAPNKFPSSVEGKGFKPLADYVHSKGLKFGIHLMRGIPKQAVRQNTPVKGTNYRAQDIANTRSTCAWNPDMYGVDMTKPGAQDYYDSVFELYASWGIDFIKVDDISRPYDRVQQLEIEAMRKAIDKTGRPIVFSLSPGDTPIEKGAHVNQYANMWRVSDDFWDRWSPLYGMFGRLNKWTPYRIEGAYPDADMLPFGIIEFRRQTRFTKDEQVTCMSLWCIARSPLMLGADMTKMDDWTIKLLTNKEVLAVNQNSTNNRQVSNKGDLIVWAADIPGSKDKYVALFNATSPGSRDVDFLKAKYHSIRIGGDGEREAEVKADIGGSKAFALAVTDGGNGFDYDHAAWLNPVLSGPAGTKKLTELRWKSATQGWGSTRVGQTSDGRRIDGIGTHAVSVIIYDRPEGYDTITARGVLADDCENRGGTVEFLVLTDEAFGAEAKDEAEVSVDFADIGIGKRARVRDLWAGQDLGTFDGSFSKVLKCHAAGLYRITPIE
jgi:hypothetical protein